jgi:hypothetical protein
MSDIIHITTIRDHHDVWGHPVAQCDPSGCAAGADRYYGEVNPAHVVRGHCYEIAEDGTVLKGHLLLREVLDAILEKCVVHPEFLVSANLRFVQKVDLVRALSLDKHNHAMWDLMTAINSLRNECSHSRDTEKRHQKTQRLIALYLTLAGNADQAVQHQSAPDEIVLMWAVAVVLDFLRTQVIS